MKIETGQNSKNMQHFQVNIFTFKQIKLKNIAASSLRGKAQ